MQAFCNAPFFANPTIEVEAGGPLITAFPCGRSGKTADGLRSESRRSETQAGSGLSGPGVRARGLLPLR
jgi:hypothetical protein